MSYDYICFIIFLLLLLIAPQVPLQIEGGIEKSQISLGFLGLLLWISFYPKRALYFPKLSNTHPLFWLIVFTLYAFIISLISGKIISIAYAVQFLVYVILGSILMRYSSQTLIKTTMGKSNLNFWTVAFVYGIGMLVSAFTGPIYPHQTEWTMRNWGGFQIQQAVGFGEGQNISGIVVVFFIAACFYLYLGRTWKKTIFLIIFLLSLLACLSRSVILSFIFSVIVIFYLDIIKMFVFRDYVKVSEFRKIGFIGFTLFISILFIIQFINPDIWNSVLLGFGLDDGHGVFLADVSTRLEKWAWGIENWTSETFLKRLFGGGFRSSMSITATGSWYTAHNMYIAILGDFGIFGLVLFMIMLFAAFFRYMKMYLSCKIERVEKFGLMTILAFSFHNLTGCYFYSPVCISLLIFVLAIT